MQRICSVLLIRCVVVCSFENTGPVLKIVLKQSQKTVKGQYFESIFKRLLLVLVKFLAVII